LWDGTWTGHTVFVATGTFNAASGDADATIDRTFVGFVTADRAAGTMHLIGTMHIDGASNTESIHERIVSGTGVFAGSTGRIVVEGISIAGVLGHGGYHGTWRRS
jgi:hypothetical protein